MKPEWRPAVGREERRQPGRQVRVDELLDAALADVRELGDRDRRDVERERDRLAVEVAAADHLVSPRRRRTRSGLSVELVASRSSTVRANASASRVAPWTCGMQRSEYGSCTLPQSLCDSAISLPASSARRLRADRDLPGVRARRVEALVERARACP